MDRFLLCADKESLMHPNLIGLDAEVLESYGWLMTTSDPLEARKIWLGSCAPDHAWVVGSDSMPALNLAAGLASDRNASDVMLVLFDPSGSAMSKAQAAGIKRVLGAPEFCSAFASEKLRMRRMRKGREAPNEHGMQIGEVDKPQRPSKLVIPTIQLTEDPGRSSQRGAQGLRTPSSSATAKSMAFLSGSGGVGKSTLCAISALAASSMGYRCAALDLDMQFGDLRALLGGARSISIEDLLERGSDALTELDVASNEMPALIGNPCKPERAEEITEHIDALLDMCLEKFEFLCLNTGSNWGEMQARILERCSFPVFVMDQRASSIRSCKNALDLCSRMGIASNTFCYALNKCKRSAPFTGIDIAVALDGVHVHELSDGGSDVEELLGAGLAKELFQDKNPLCESVSGMLESIAPNAGLSRKPIKHAGKRSRRASLVGEEGQLSQRKPKGRRRHRSMKELFIPAGTVFVPNLDEVHP